MSATKTHKANKANQGKVTFSTTVKDYSNDPFVMKKTKSAEELIKKIGLPPKLIK